MQIGARISQDQTISKDPTLWNRQGSQVLRGQALVLPVGNTFLYLDPLYIQASEARMPQLKKVVLAIGNTLIYRGTYEQALADLSALMQGAVAEAGKETIAASAVRAAPGEPMLEFLETVNRQSSAPIPRTLVSRQIGDVDSHRTPGNAPSAADTPRTTELIDPGSQFMRHPLVITGFYRRPYAAAMNVGNSCVKQESHRRHRSA